MHHTVLGLLRCRVIRHCIHLADGVSEIRSPGGGITADEFGIGFRRSGRLALPAGKTFRHGVYGMLCNHDCHPVITDPVPLEA